MLYSCEPLSAAVSRRASTCRYLADTASMSVGLAPGEPENFEPSDIDTVNSPIVVPEGELFGRDVTADVKVTAVGSEGAGGSTGVTAIVKVAELLNSRFIPCARIPTE